ncbi:MAG TPA: MBL fold metallo-hydrolase [Candidatus Angelobacter sp.]|nr:MBL fold metallo-hydrolase [Candidatus Angelobacter sp.]
MRIRALVLFAATAGAAWSQQLPKQTAADLIHSALAAMGGEQKLRELKTLHLKTVGHRNLLEQSERPEGPYIIDYEQTDEWRDLERGNWRREVHRRNAVEEDTSTVLVADGVAAQKSGDHEMPGSGQELQEADDALTMGPERVLLNALAAENLKRLPDLMLQGVPHHVIEFSRAGTPVRIYLNAETHLPTAVEWVTAYPYGMFWSIWGDVSTRVYYSLWWLQEGLHYPLQTDTFRNGMLDRSAAIVKLEFNQPVKPGDFTISPSTREAFAARGLVTADDRPLGGSSRPVQEPAPGIVILPGAWNTTIIRQPDGIVILEAPISSGYSSKVLAEAKRRFPNVAVKAVITTSDAWPHIGGLREYVARGIPVYVLDRTEPLIHRLLNAPRNRHPDAFATSARRPIFHLVSRRVDLGTGSNRMEIFPLHGEFSERQMMVYFPEHKLLYGSDAFQKLPDGQYFIPQTVSEVADAVQREHLEVKNFFMMHMGVTTWQEVLSTLRNPE